MTAANHLLRAGGGCLLLSRCNPSSIINASRLLLLPPFPPKSLSSISLLHSIPSPSAFAAPSNPTPANFRCLCATADTAEAPPPTTTTEAPDMDAVKEAAKLLDIRIGKVLKAWRHPDADSLYVEEVDIGEPEPRTICSGLVKYVPIEHLQDKKVIVLANLKPRNMRGIKSSGMLMAASDGPHENVELLAPPEDSVPGERIWFGSEDEKENQPAAASPNQIQKKKVWEAVQPHLKTDAACVAMLDGLYMMTSAGPVVSKSLKNANIS